MQASWSLRALATARCHQPQRQPSQSWPRRAFAQGAPRAVGRVRATGCPARRTGGRAGRAVRTACGDLPATVVPGRRVGQQQARCMVGPAGRQPRAGRRRGAPGGFWTFSAIARVKWSLIAIFSWSFSDRDAGALAGAPCATGRTVPGCPVAPARRSRPATGA